MMHDNNPGFNSLSGTSNVLYCMNINKLWSAIKFATVTRVLTAAFLATAVGMHSKSSRMSDMGVVMG